MAGGRQLVQTHGDLCAVEFRKRVSSRSSLRCGLNSSHYRARLFEGDKPCQLFVGSDDESLSVVGVSWSWGCSSGFDQSLVFWVDAISPKESWSSEFKTGGSL
jgi:hypothetical protein